MGVGALRYYILGGLVLLVIGAGGAFFYAFESSLPTIEPVRAPASSALPAPAPIPVPVKPEVSIWIKNGKTVVVEWRHLPLLTSRIDIFRGKGSGAAYAFWKSLNIAGSDLNSGSQEIRVSAGDAPMTYFYYIASFSGDGSSLWTSTSTPPTTEPPVVPPPIATTPPPTTTLPPATTTPTSTPPVTNPTSTPTSTPPVTTSTEPVATTTPPVVSSTNPFAYPPGSILFYSPSGQITGYIVPVTYTFWAQYIDNKIELNWQNVPSDTDSLYVFRSAASSGPWTSLLTQYHPTIGAPGSIKIVDETVSQPFYYRMEARAGSQTLGIYGPVFLPGLSL